MVLIFPEMTFARFAGAMPGAGDFISLVAWGKAGHGRILG
jgi:hypothetical protein